MDIDTLKVVAFIVGELLVGLAGAYATVRSLKPNMQKSAGEKESFLGGALEKAGETLEDAWTEIRKLREELGVEREARKKEVEAERNERKKLEKELRRWTRFAGLLVEELKKYTDKPVEFPPETKD